MTIAVTIATIVLLKNIFCMALISPTIVEIALIVAKEKADARRNSIPLFLSDKVFIFKTREPAG